MPREFIGDQRVTSPQTLITALATAMTQKNYRVYYDDYNERTLLYRLGAEGPQPVTLLELKERVRAAVLLILAHIAKNDEGDPAARVARSTRCLIEQGAPGTAAYVARVATAARDRLPLLSDEEHEEIVASLRRPADKRERGNYHAERRAKLAAQYDTHARKVVAHWLTGLPAGKHDLGELWKSWRAAVTSSPNLAENFPGAIALGKTKFYALLAELGTVKSGHARRRYLVVD